MRDIQSPARYMGCEWGSIKKTDYRLKVCLAFPDLYEVGMSYYGYQILYHIFNSIDGVACSRAYLPWIDMQEYLKSKNKSLCDIETGKPLKSADLIGITLQTEMNYPGIVRLLHLADIPYRAIDRKDDDPIIIGGGPKAFHPEPIAPFFDAIVVGDAENIIRQIAQKMMTEQFCSANRTDKWQILSAIQGVYAPQLYRYSADQPSEIIPLNGAPKRIRSGYVSELSNDNYPVLPIVPNIQTEHDRYVIEIMRGCSQGCRFCQAGLINRPVRERSVNDIINQAIAGLEHTGWREVSLLSLSTSDYSQLHSLIGGLLEHLLPYRASLAFPSLRPASFTEDIASLTTSGRKSTLTFAVEAGSQRLRNIINKPLDEEELMAAIERAMRYGWTGLKLYFMVGLPDEVLEDIYEGVNLLKRITRLIPRKSQLHVSVAPFIPKPQSIFERSAYLPDNELAYRQRLLLRDLPKSVKAVWRDPFQSRIEAVLGRGDRRMADVIQEVALKGYGFETWGSEFSSKRWNDALGHHFPDWNKLTEEIPPNIHQPWEHITAGISPRFIRDELSKSTNSLRTSDCRTDKCVYCGLMVECDELNENILTTENNPTVTLNRDYPTLIEPHEGAPKHKYRLYFRKLHHARWLGHLDLMRLMGRALIRAGIPFAYSKGNSPRPLMTYGKALPMGVGAAVQWIEFETTMPIDQNNLATKLKKFLITGLKPVKAQEIIGKKIKNNSDDVNITTVRLRFHDKITFNTDNLAQTIAAQNDKTNIIDYQECKLGKSVYIKVDTMGIGIFKALNLTPIKTSLKSITILNE